MSVKRGAGDKKIDNVQIGNRSEAVSAIQLRSAAN
jgi:hypothetical protein